MVFKFATNVQLIFNCTIFWCIFFRYELQTHTSKEING